MIETVQKVTLDIYTNLQDENESGSGINPVSTSLLDIPEEV